MTRTLLLLAALALLAHGASLGHGFVYDDHRFVERNPSLVDLSVGRALLDPATHTADRDRDVYRPLRALGHAFDLSRWGPDPFGFHLHSLLAHVLCVLLGYVVLRHLLGARESLAAFAGAALLAVHPLGVEVADWISSRGDEYALLFGLAALALGTGWLRTPVVAAGLAAPCGALAVLGKESAAVLPLVAFLAVRMLPGAAREPDASRPDGDDATRRWVLPAALGVGAVAALVLRQVALSGMTPVQTAPHGGSHATQTVWAFFGLARTLVHVVFPAGLAVEYPQEAWAAAGLAAAVPAALVGLTLAALPLVLRKRAPVPAFLLAWALLAYLPSSSLLVTLRSLVNDRAAYPCLLPLGALLGWCLARLPALRVRGVPRRSGWLALALLLALLVPLTWSRCAVFRDDASLWSDVLARDPSSVRAWVGLAAVEAERDPEAAGRDLSRAVQVAVPGSKQEALALVRLGDHVLHRQGDPAAALPLLEHALEAARRWRERGVPSLDELDTAVSLAEALTRLQRYDDGEQVLTRLIAEDPSPARLWLQLAGLRLVHAQMENDPDLLDGVRAALDEALRLAPDDAQIQQDSQRLARLLSGR
ncbi:MAG: tetratricopeptide repeat protein [Planctomycetes bacterium]|nr:tetratricopeptide repeat protein [Planctomycetota bacterium]